jgi:AcrR family transcriptional regulator
MNIRQTVLQEGMNIFQRYGIKCLSLDAIIAELKIAKGTFFEIADSKAEFLEQCIAESVAERKARLAVLLEKATDPLTALQQVLRTHLQALAGNHPDFLRDLKNHHPACWEQVQAFSEKHLQSCLQNLLAQGAEAGLIRPDVNALLLSRLWLAQVRAVAEADLTGTFGFGFDTVFEAAFGPNLAGIATPKGLKLLQPGIPLNALSLEHV